MIALAVSLCCLLLFAGVSGAADVSDPILKTLVEKGILTKEEALDVLKEMDREAAQKAPKAEENIETKVSEEKAGDSAAVAKVVKAMKGFKFGMLSYLSYQNGELGDQDDGRGFSQFAIKRGYFRVTKELLPWFDAHVTFDMTTVSDPEEPEDAPNNLDGSIAVRIKYACGKFKLPDFAFFYQALC